MLAACGKASNLSDLVFGNRPTIVAADVVVN
jgi:hypothetical protein